MPYAAIDPLKLQVLPLSQRRNLLRLAEETDQAMEADSAVEPDVEAKIAHLAEKMRAARDRKAAIMLTYGAHLIKNGAGPLLNRLIEAGLASHLATQGPASSTIGNSPSKAIRASRSAKMPRQARSALGRDGPLSEPGGIGRRRPKGSVSANPSAA